MGLQTLQRRLSYVVTICKGGLLYHAGNVDGTESKVLTIPRAGLTNDSKRSTCQEAPLVQMVQYDTPPVYKANADFVTVLTLKYLSKCAAFPPTRSPWHLQFLTLSCPTAPSVWTSACNRCQETPIVLAHGSLQRAACTGTPTTKLACSFCRME